MLRSVVRSGRFIAPRIATSAVSVKSAAPVASLINALEVASRSISMSSGVLSAASAPAGVRVESDTMGKVEVSNAVYWGAQTQRSLENFKIGGPQARMPIEIIRGE